MLMAGLVCQKYTELASVTAAACCCHPSEDHIVSSQPGNEAAIETEGVLHACLPVAPGVLGASSPWIWVVVVVAA